MKNYFWSLQSELNAIFQQGDFAGIQEYRQRSVHQILKRTQLLAAAQVVLMAYLLCVDMLSGLMADLPQVWIGNVVAHTGLFVLSCTMTALSNRWLRKPPRNAKVCWWAVRLYILLGMMLINFMSLSSEAMMNGSSVYVMSVLAVALVFPFEPGVLTLIFIVNHAIQIGGVLLVQENEYVRTSYIVNGTIAVLLALVAVYYLERSRRDGFIAERALRISEESFRKMFFSNPLPVLVVRQQDGKVLLANKKAENFYSMRESEGIKGSVPDIFVREENWGIIVGELNEKGSIQNRILEHTDQNGHKKWTLANFEKIEYGGKEAVLCEVADITELKRMENELAVHATTDPLTGVYNRRKGVDLLQSAMREAKRGGRSVVVCFTDLNGLKKVNDHFGHAEGDSYICTVCNAIAGEKEKEDILFRYGGDEFVILFRGKEEERAREICDRVKARLETAKQELQKPYDLGVSMGLSAFDPEGTLLTAAQLMEAADRENYLDK